MGSGGHCGEDPRQFRLCGERDDFDSGDQGAESANAVRAGRSRRFISIKTTEGFVLGSSTRALLPVSVDGNQAVAWSHANQRSEALPRSAIVVHDGDVDVHEVIVSVGVELPRGCAERGSAREGPAAGIEVP